MSTAAYRPNPEQEARERLRLRRMHHRAALRAGGIAAFLARTQIEVPVTATDTAMQPFAVWPAQADVLTTIEAEDRVLFLKARQLGISWLVCGYALWLLTLYGGQTVLAFSRGQLEANELIRRVGVLYDQHRDRWCFPALPTRNTEQIVTADGSRMLSLPATQGGGRTFTASLAILDEFAFMRYGLSTLAAVKPTVDAGGKLLLISTADGPGTAYHQLWLAAEAHQNGYAPVFLPWTARPERGPTWRDARLAESGGDSASVLREYPATPGEAFTQAADRVYGETWLDSATPDDPTPVSGNVTAAADYVPDCGPIYWALDDGYSAGSAKGSAGLDPATRQYVADAHPRVILLAQLRADGRLCIFAEHYACVTLSDPHLTDALALAPASDDPAQPPYPVPDLVVHGPGAAEIRGRLHAAGLAAQQGAPKVEESIKELRRALAPDANGWQRVLVHPRCGHLRHEFQSYRRDAAGAPIKAHDHGPDALRGLVWALRGQL